VEKPALNQFADRRQKHAKLPIGFASLLHSHAHIRFTQWRVVGWSIINFRNWHQLCWLFLHQSVTYI